MHLSVHRGNAPVQEAVDALELAEGTSLNDAAGEAVDLISSVKGRRAVILLTDGEDTKQCPARGRDLLGEKGGGVPIYTVGLGAEVGDDVLKTLATEMRGEYYPVRDVNELRRIFEEIAVKQGQLFQIAYRTNREVPDGTLRPIQVVYKTSRSVGTTSVFIRGMVVPARGWSSLFLCLVGLLVSLYYLPRLMRSERQALPLED